MGLAFDDGFEDGGVVGAQVDETVRYVELFWGERGRVNDGEWKECCNGHAEGGLDGARRRAHTCQSASKKASLAVYLE